MTKLSPKSTILAALSLLCILTGIASCSTTPISKTSPAPQELSTEKKCEMGSPFACFELGQHKIEEGKLDEARSLITKACTKDLGWACSNLGGLEFRRKNYKSAFKFSLKACELGDAVGCYNMACYACDLNSDTKKTLQFLKRSYGLGFNEPEALEGDSQLQCVRGLPEFKELTDQMRKRKDAFRTGPTHFFLQHLGAMFIPLDLKEKSFGQPVVMQDGPNLSVKYFSLSHPFKDAHKESSSFLQSLKKIDPSAIQTDITVTSRNGHGFQTSKFEFRKSGLSYGVHMVITGSTTHSVVGVATYLNSLDPSLISAVTKSVDGVILNPDRPLNQNTFAFKIDFASLGFNYDGINIGALSFKRPGQKNAEEVIGARALLLPELKPGEIDGFLKDATSAEFRLLNGSSADSPEIKFEETRHQRTWTAVFRSNDPKKKSMLLMFSQLKEKVSSRILLITWWVIPSNSKASFDVNGFKNIIEKSTVRPDVIQSLKDTKPLRMPVPEDTSGTGKTPFGALPLKPFLTSSCPDSLQT